MSKTQLYKDLLARMTKSNAEEFYLESSWIQYAIIEDRLNSVIRHAYPERGTELLETLRGMDRKITHITDKIHPKDQDCATTVHKLLLKTITKWKDRRNDLMHEIESAGSYTMLQSRTKKLALEGVKHVNDICNRVRKYKEAVSKRS